MKKHLLLFLFTITLFASCKKYLVVDDQPSTSNLDERVVGASANELLSSSKYKSLRLEIQYMTGFAPDAAAVTHLQNYLTAHLNKPGGITVMTKEITAGTNQVLNVNDLASIEKANRTAYTYQEELSIYILITNGNYTENNVLGVAYRNTALALFGKKIKDNSGGLTQPSRTKLEATVLEHEVGHLLGLVDLGTNMVTNHKANGNHCSNQDCLMYYAAETTDILGFLVTGNIPTLDANCISDIKANGGK
jgi:pectin methylesterase-like acyl-CoA thioesterase